MASAERTFRGVSAEDRRARRREKLLDACLSVIGSDGILGVTVDRVCQEAELTKRYLYENFANLDELLAACADAMFSGLYARMSTETAQQEKGVQKARTAVRSVAQTLADDPRQARLYVECAAHPLMAARRDLAIEAFTAYMTSEVARAAPDSPGLALRVRLVVAGGTDIITSMLAGKIHTSVDDIVDAVIAVSVDL